MRHDTILVVGEDSFAGPLSAAVADLCERLRPQVSAATSAGFDDVLRRLAAPLQVAVAGRIKSGKSTLVNALIGRRVAPTDIGECTRLVTRFSYDALDRVEVIFTDGTKQVLPFDDEGMIPAELGVDLDKVSHLEAYLTNAVLRELTVIDTPGLGSLDAGSVARTEQVLDPVSANAVAGAEAVLYVLTQSVRADDREVLAAFTAATASRDAGPVNALAVLNKADTVVAESVAGSDGNVWQAASLLARRQAEVLGTRVADVIPVIGLLAESAETGRFTSADAYALRDLAQLDEATTSTMLVSAELFATWDAPVPAATRARLLACLDLYGIDCAITAIRDQPNITTGSLRRLMLDLSGLAEVRGRLDLVFRAQGGRDQGGGRARLDRGAGRGVRGAGGPAAGARRDRGAAGASAGAPVAAARSAHPDRLRRAGPAGRAGRRGAAGRRRGHRRRAAGSARRGRRRADRVRAGTGRLVAFVRLVRVDTRAEPGGARGASGVFPDLAATARTGGMRMGPDGTDPQGAASQMGVRPDEVDLVAAVDPIDPYGLLETALAERRAVILLCLYALDRARSTGVATQLERGLAEVGIAAVRPDGQRFDPAHHEAGGTVPTDDPELVGLIAETEAVGFMDHGRVLRAPVVLVYAGRP